MTAHKSGSKLDYKFILHEGKDAACRHMIGCESSKCNTCRRRTKDQIVKVLG